VFNHRPDAICVSGLVAGSQTDVTVLSQVKDAVSSIPVFANTGVRLENVEEQLKIADGAVVGTAFKFEGQFGNHVDLTRVKKFMVKVNSLRS
jgi:predicted TIM-barrel enzyme